MRKPLREQGCGLTQLALGGELESIHASARIAKCVSLPAISVNSPDFVEYSVSAVYCSVATVSEFGVDVDCVRSQVSYLGNQPPGATEVLTWPSVAGRRARGPRERQREARPGRPKTGGGVVAGWSR